MRQGSMRLVAVLAFVCGLAAAPSAPALPVGVAYPGLNNALAQPNAPEQEVLNFMDTDRAAQGLNRLRWDGMMSAVAREQSEDMAAHGYSYYDSPRLGTLEYRLHRAGVSAGNARFAVYHMPSVAALAENMRKSRLHVQPGTDVGIGIVMRSAQDMHVTMIFVEKYSVLEPFPTLPILSAEYKLAGRLDADLVKPGLYVTGPDGKVTDQHLKLSADHKFNTTVKFDKGRGEYSVEVTASGKLGPMVVDLMHCYAGVEYPPPTLPPKKVAVAADVSEGEQKMFGLINRARAAAHLSAVAYDARLADAARLHSADMAENKYFAHISPTLGDITRRMAKAGIKAKKFMENIANNQDLDSAHHELMESPGHRKTILDPDITHVGVGIVHAEGGQLLITEDFKEEFRSYDTDALAARLIQGINEARAAARVGALGKSDLLSGAALDSSRALLQAGKLDQNKSKAVVSQKVKYGFVEIRIMESGDPPKPQQFAEALKARYQKIGVGIVQDTSQSGNLMLWTTLLLGER